MLLLFSSSKTINFFKAGTIKRQDTLFEDQNVAMVPVQAFGVALIVGYVLASFVIKEVLAIISEDVYYVVGICKLMGVSLVCICAVIFTRIFRHKAEAHRHAKILAESSAMLRMATSALNASSTAVAVVDEHRVITMYNPAFQFVLCHSDDTDLKNIQLEAVLNLSTEDLSMLQWAFQTSDKPTVEVDFVLGSKVIRVAVSAISMDAAEKLYYVVLQDLTEKYALQQAVSRARQAALGLLHAAGARQVGGSQPHLIAPEETNPNRG